MKNTRTYLHMSSLYPDQLDRLEYLRPITLDWRICRRACAGFLYALDLMNLGPHDE